MALIALFACGVAKGATAPQPAVTIEWVGDIALSSERGLPSGGLTRALALRVTLGPGGRILAGRLLSIRLSDALPRLDATDSSEN